MKNTVIFFLITLVLFCILVMSSIFAIAIHDIDKVQQQSEKRIIRSVLQENKKDVAAICHEYAWWDKAYNNLVENYNRGWIASNIGSYLIENQDITCSFVISGSTNTIYSNIGGKEKKVDLFEISHGGLKQLLRDARDCPLDRPEPVRGYLEVNDKLYFVGATAITPYTWKAGPSISPRSVLVLAREMDKDFLERLSAEYNIGSPALESRTGDDPTGAQIPLYGTNEVQLGSLTWSPRLPSGMFVREILPYAVLALAVIALITWLIISRLTQITREMSANRNFLRDVTDSLPGALYQFQMNSRGEMDFNYMSRGFLEMAELNSDEDLTDSNMIFGLVVPEDLDGLYNSIRESYKGMLPWSHDFRIQTKSGVKWIFGSSMPRNHVSDIIVWNGVLVDITVTKEKQALEKDYREMVENQSELICRWLPDTTLTFVNLAYADFFGVDAQEVLGKKWIEFLPEHEKSGDLTGIYSLTPQEPVNENENYAQRKDGAWRWLAWTNKAFFDDQGAITHVLGVGRDLTEQRRAEEELRRSHESLEKRVEVRTSELKFANEHLAEEIREKEEYARELQETNEMYKLLTENMFDVIWKARITPDGSWQFIYRSPSVQNLLGYTPDEAMANPFQCLASWSYDDLLNTVSENCDRLFSLVGRGDGNPDVGPLRQELELIRKDGQKIWTETLLRIQKAETGNTAEIDGVTRDITPRKLLEKKLEELSLYDSLTGLYSRAFFEQEMERLKDGRYLPMAIMVFDLDGLKVVNDNFGHRQGDELLRSAARLLGSCLRESDILARIGGDEFAVLLPQSSQAVVEDIAGRIRNKIKNHNLLHPGPPLAISTGWAACSAGPVDMEDLFREADNNMYREKILNKENK